MKNLIHFGITIVLVLSFYNGFGQVGWEKVSGSKTEVPTIQEKRFQNIFQDPEFNLGGVGSPSPRSSASLWQDAEKNVWIFGGIGFGEDGQWGLFGDLWKLNLATNVWQLQSGERNKAVDMLSKSQYPDARRDAISWIDKHGVLWLMGGKMLNDNEFLSDVWSYDPKKQLWANVKVKGSFNQNANWGKKGNSDGNSSPGSRSGAATWIDKKGNLWLFGGASQIYGEGKQNYYSDLWQFNTSSRAWKWVSGNDKPNQKSTYKKKSKEVVILPGGRVKASSWYDENNDCLWLYGGEGIDSSGIDLGALADLWRYDIAADSWEWAGGGQGLYERTGKNKNFNKTSPGYRSSATHWTDNAGNFWLYGGQNKLDQAETDVDQVLWKFDVKSKKWAMVFTANPPNIISDGRGFISSDGLLMQFGGQKINFNNLKTYPTNEVWKTTIKK